MRQQCDGKYDKMTSESLIRCLKAINEYHEGENVQSMQDRLKDIERTRHLKVWHDLSTIAKHSHLVFMVCNPYMILQSITLMASTKISLAAKTQTFKRRWKRRKST
jgi:hypothetical protein